MPLSQYIQRALHSACIDNFAKGVTFINQYTANGRSAPCIAIVGNRSAVIATIANAIGSMVTKLLLAPVDRQQSFIGAEEITEAMWILLHFEEIPVNNGVVIYWQHLEPLTS